MPHLLRCLHCLHKHDRAFLIQNLHILRYLLCQSVIHGSTVQPYLRSRRHIAHRLPDLLIGLYRHTFLRQPFQYLHRKYLLMCKQRDLLLRQKQIRQENRRMRNISSSQIKKPRYLVQCGHQQLISLLFLHFGPNFLDLVLSALTCIFHMQFPNRLF